MVRQNREQLATRKVRRQIPPPQKSAKSDETHTSSLDKFKVVFIKPKVIFNKSDEKPYAKTDYTKADFPDLEAAMIGNTLSIGGIRINAHDFPECISVGHTLPKSECYICEFFSVSDCPIRRDPTTLREASAIIAQNKRFWKEDREYRDSIIDAIYSELKSHGRPLHYEVLARIIHDRYPKLKLVPWRVLKIMTAHPEKFSWVDTGVYKAN
jgi:hypothetical protein